MPEDFKAGFLKTLWILRDYLSAIVIGGGWVSFLYHRYLLSNKYEEPIRTRDIDLLVDIEVPKVGEKSVDNLLLEAGFKPTFKSLDTPPAVHYEGTIEGEEVEIEFLTDQRGARNDIVIEVQKGLHAEALRFISIPINYAIKVNIDDFRIGENITRSR
jgi:predicted nucleotidyltransferase